MSSTFAQGARWSLAALSLVWAAPAALAEEKVIHEADKTIVRKKTVIDFTDVAVEGDLTKPEGSYVLDRNKTRFQSLVKIRDNFVPEMQKSADNL